MNQRLVRPLAYASATLVSLIFFYPYWWMLVSSFRDAEAILTEPLRLLPETFSTKALGEIARIGGVSLSTFVWNSLLIRAASTAIAVIVTALGAYALMRRPELSGFRWVRFGFLLTIMYPYMLLVIPVYIVMFHLGLLGTYTGMILFLSLGPVQFFLFEQFFRMSPKEMLEAALVDGAS